MISEAIKRIVDLTNESSQPKPIPLTDERKEGFVVNGKVELFDVTDGSRDHIVHGIADLIAAADRWVDDSGGVLFHNESGVTLIVKDDDRFDRVTLPLVYHPQFVTLQKLADKPTLDQDKLIELLRHDLLDAAPDALLPQIRKLKVSTKGGMESDKQHGRERGMKEYDAELAGAAEIPETLTIVTPVYSNVGLVTGVGIRATLSYSIPSLTFKLAPAPNELEAAIQFAQSEIAGHLGEIEKPVSIFYGRFA